MIRTLDDFHNPFFIGVAGSGMSAIAQYLAGIGKRVSGSDRYFTPGSSQETRIKLQQAGINCYIQNGEGITETTDLIIVSTAIEDSVDEVIKAKKLQIPILKRSEVLSLIADSKKSIAIAGTSGKSTTSAMLFHILQAAGLQPGIISGAGLTALIEQGRIGNAAVGSGEWLVIETDESDGSIIQYTPEVGVLLNIDKDHKEIEELLALFQIFKGNSKQFITNRSHVLATQFSANSSKDFAVDLHSAAGFIATDFVQTGLMISFKINGIPFNVNIPGRHNMENVLAATTAAHLAGVSLEDSAQALADYKGIYRRHQVYGRRNGVWLIDDFAHNPAKCAASIAACQPFCRKVIAWFQPHGYGPTKFLRKDFAEEFSKVLRDDDEIWMSEIYYAGGSAIKDISAKDLVNDLKQLNKNAFYIEDRNNFLSSVTAHLEKDCVLLLMGARDPSLDHFAKAVWEKL